MAEGDKFIFEGDLSETAAELQRIIDVVRRNVALEEQIGDEESTILIRLRSMEAQLSERLSVVTGGASAPQVAETTAAIEEQNAALERTTQLELFNLDALRKQNEQYVEQLALIDQLQAGQMPLFAEKAAAAPLVAPAGVQLSAEQQAALASQEAMQRRLAEQQAYYNEQLAAETPERLRAIAIQREQYQLAQEQLRTQTLIDERMAAAYGAGTTAAQAGRLVPASMRTDLAAAPIGVGAGQWGAEEAELVRYKIALGEYNTFAGQASLSSQALSANLTRLGMAEAEASNSMRVHGALTTEYLGALVRGETTISELGYQVSATIGKFAGWTIAAGAVYTALGAVFEFGKGAIDTASAVQQLTRTIEPLDKMKASTALQNLSADVNVPIKEAGDAVFLFSRTFHNLDDAVEAARLALSTFKLDGVSLADSVKAQTAIHQQFGISARGLIPIYDELAQGQQKFNARVTEQIPALLKSSAAVKIAGGDLRQLIELTTIALRTTSLSGSQVGTAFSRSAANFLNPTTTKGQADRAVLRGLGLDTSLGYTDLIFQAINKAPSMTPNQISQMTQAIFGPLRGGLMAGIFTGGPNLVGPVSKELSPEGAKGTLQTELAKELDTVTQELHAFVNGLQRVGAALAQTGTLTPFGLALHVIVGALDALRGVIDIFDQLPHAAKQVASGLVEARIAMLLLSRTSIGGSIANATGLSRLGLGPSLETQQRQALGKGTFNALKAVESDFARTQSQLLTNGASQAVLEKRRAVIQAEIARSGMGTRTEYEASNRVSAEILALQRQQAELELQSAAQLAVQRDLETQYVGVQKRRGPKAYSSAQVDELSAATAAGSVGAAEAGAAQDKLAAQTGVFTFAAQKAKAGAARAATALGASSAASEELSVAVSAETVALQEALAADAVLAVAMVDATAAALEAAAAAAVDTAETVTLGSALAATGGAIAGLGGSLIGMVGAIDPLLLGLIGLPIAFELLSSWGSDTDAALQKAITASKKPVTNLKELEDHAAALQKIQDYYVPPTPPAPITPINGAPPTIYAKGQSPQELATAAKHRLDAQAALDKAQSPQEQARHPAYQILENMSPGWRRYMQPAIDTPSRASVAKGYVGEVNALDAQAKEDAKNMKNTRAGQEQYYRQLAALKAQAQAYIKAHPGAAADVKDFYTALNAQLQKDYQAQQDAMALGRTPKDLFTQFEKMSPADIRKRVTGLGDVFTAGIGSEGSLSQASAAIAYLGNKINKGSSSADLQAFGAAMQSFQSDLHKLVGDYVHAAASTPSAGVQTADLAKARQFGVDETKNIRTELALSIEKYKGNKSAIAKAIALANYRLGLVADEMASVQQADDARIQAASALTASKITGSSPEAQIARAEVALNGLRQELASAKADKASWAVVSGLMTQINTAENALADQRVANAKSLLDANSAVAKARITGQTPAAELARAQADVRAAQADLAFDTAHHAGQAQIATDYANLLNARDALNNTIRQNSQTIDQDAAALIQARAGLAEAQTTDPVAQARDELAAAIKVLRTIKPTDYKTYSEYQAAVLQQQTTIAKDRQNVTQQYVDVQMSSLQFELHTQRITDQQYVSGLQQLLKLKKLTTQQRQQILTEIYDTTQQAAVSLNTDSIRMPTTYEVRRAIQSAARAAGGHPTQWASGPVKGGDTVNNVRMNITVTKDADLKKFAQVLDDALNSNFTGSAQAMGAI